MKWLIIFSILVLILLPTATSNIVLVNDLGSKYNLGDRIELKTLVTVEEKFSGFLKANLNCNNLNMDYYIAPVSLPVGDTELAVPAITLTESMLGFCKINLRLEEMNENLLEEKELLSFNLTKVLGSNLLLDKTEVLPADTIRIEGSISKADGTLIESGEIKFNLQDKNYVAEIIDAAFAYKFNLNENIKSGQHDLMVNFEDEYGNIIAEAISFNILQVPTKIKTSLNDIEFFPGDTIGISASLYDQADDLIEEDINILIYNPKEKLVYEGVNDLNTELATDAMPGTWIVKSSFEDISSENKFIVKKTQDIEVYVEDGILYIKNIGNVDYKEATEIRVGDAEFTKNLNLEPNEVAEINLGKKVYEEGDYNVSIVTKEGEENLGEVEISEAGGLTTGLAIFGSKGGLARGSTYLIVLLVVIVALFLYFNFKGRRIKTLIREKGVKEGKKKLKTIKEKREKPKSKYRPTFFAGRKIEEGEAKDFKESILKSIEESDVEKADLSKLDEEEGYKIIKPTEEKEEPREKVKEEEGDKKKNLFSMFD